jgi:hypothetical protein
MKKILIVLPLLIIVLFTACKKDKEEQKPDNKVLVQQLFQATMGGFGTMSGEKSTQPINFQVDYTMNSSLGGNIHVLGSITGSMNYNDETYQFTGGSMNLGFTETASDFVFSDNGINYTLNGAPYVTLTGYFTYLPDMTFGTASSLHYAGAYRVTGDNFDETINLDITIIINSNGTGGTVSGYIGDDQINYTF